MRRDKDEESRRKAKRWKTKKRDDDKVDGQEEAKKKTNKRNQG